MYDPNSPPPLIGFPVGDLATKTRLAKIHSDTSASPVTSDEYHQTRGNHLGTDVNSRLKIYLDTKFWIMLRDAQEDPKTGEPDSELFQLLLQLVQSGRAICPMADCAFMELLKQGQHDKRLATARVMDALSQGVSLKSQQDRIRAEILHFLLRHSEDALPLNQLVWTRIGNVLGYFVPGNMGMDPLLFNSTLKGFADLIWSLSLVDMISVNQTVPLDSTEFFSNLAGKLNMGKFEYAHQVTDFKTVFKSELHGVIDSNREDINNAMPYIFESRVGGVPPCENEKLKSGQRLANLIYAALSETPDLIDLPTFRITAGTNAVIRLNKDRRYKPNDWLDIMHASAGLPYCDIFATENSLATLVSQKPLKFG